MKYKRLGKPTRLPDPIPDTHHEAWWSGIGVGIICALALGVIFFLR